jgi:glycosidase
MRARAVFLAAAAAIAIALTNSAPATFAQTPAARDARDEVIYFVLPDRFENANRRNDRGGLRGGPLRTGYDPTHKGFYHGGDLAGLAARLDYIQGLGATAVWLGPVYRNKAVQGAPGHESAGYHGYWITDFTEIDPHFGTRADFRRFVDAAHARGMRVYMDIITNHTADVIQYSGCSECPYRSQADYPYTRRGGVDGPAINDGFLGEGAQTTENFTRLTDPNYAYELYVPAAERQIKHPLWLNDPAYYHNRGNTTFRSESSLMGDFSGLDDLFTEHPRVVQGFIDIYGAWIDEFGIDGFRIDTARHVNPEFWRAFVPAMLERARARGIPHFYIFGEVYDPDPGHLARFTRVDGFPAVLDFAFQSAAYETIARAGGVDRLNTMFESDALYEGGPDAALALPTFLGNHDMGRFAHFVLRENPDISDQELLQRVTLGHALMMFARGVPVIYYGDEQGFVGDGGDQDAREDMFVSEVASYNDNRFVGAAAAARSSFDANSPLYRSIAQMAALRAAHPALRRGRQVVRAYQETPGAFAFSRLLDGDEILVVLNTSREPLAQNVGVEPASAAWRSLHGACAATAVAPGTLAVRIPPLDYIACISEQP